jgi:tetratricopeptide (TPR) repeat protein
VHHQKASVPHALVIHGLGGTGKTQLALKYVEDYKDKYNPILWIDAKDEESVLFSFERCASELQLSLDRTQTQNFSLLNSPTVQAVRRWLDNRKDTDDAWLMIVDNADDVSWGIMKVLPKGSRGNIIITSQDSHSRELVDGGCEELFVDTMEPLEARALLLRRLEWDLDPVPQGIQDDCDKITQQLGYLALAIDLAGAYIHNDPDQRQTLRRYPAIYEKHRDHRLQSEESRGLLPSDKTVWTVWDTTLEKIKKRYPELRPDLLLAFLARFKGVVVQDELFRLASLAMPEVCEKLYYGTVKLPSWLDNALTADNTLTAEDGAWNNYHYQESQKVLVRYSLLQRTKGDWPGVSMHGLVQWRARKYEDEQPWEIWHLMTVLAGCVQLSKDEARPEFRRELVTHTPALGETYLDVLKIEDSRKEFVWHTVSTLLFYEGRWKEAEELEVQVMDTRKRVLGEEHPDTLTSMANLASTYQNQGRWKEAEELDMQVMDTRKRVLGEEHPDTLTSMANLASTYRNQGRWKEAEELEVQVMDTRKRVLGEEHPYTLTSMANLASTYRNQGRWKEAEELEVQVMDTRKRVLGEEHPSTLTSMNNLALTYQNQGRWKEAEELQVQVMDTRKRVLGEEHPSTLTSMANLASTYRNQGRWKEAEELEVQVMDTRKRVLGEEHPDTLTSMANLASTYWNQGRWKEAEELEVQVMDTRKRVLGEEHPDTLTSMANLASTYWNQGRWKEAEELEVQVMDTSARVLGEEHPDTLTIMNNLAFTLNGQGRTVEAILLLENCLQVWKRVFGPQHPKLLSSFQTLDEWRVEKT